MIKEVFGDNKAVAAAAPGGFCWCFCSYFYWWDLDMSIWFSIPF